MSQIVAIYLYTVVFFSALFGISIGVCIAAMVSQKRRLSEIENYSAVKYDSKSNAAAAHIQESLEETSVAVNGRINSADRAVSMTEFNSAIFGVDEENIIESKREKEDEAFELLKRRTEEAGGDMS
jgi:MFS superfamily sulfate permease-like transporter